ncbi:MAG: hypothetical protein AAFX00_11350, partial [Pseudomonadota bacterium]
LVTDDTADNAPDYFLTEVTKPDNTVILSDLKAVVAARGGEISYERRSTGQGGTLTFTLPGRIM